ncbi:hypothetical protein VTO73DRAFT_10163 [Trametes versicolor]
MALKRSRTTESSQPPYTPLYVTPLIFLSSPTPPTSRTATYTLTRPPGCLLAVGTAVCLCLAQAQCLESRGSSRVAQTAAGSPAIWGWIAGERSRTVDEVEYVVKNEDRNAPILRAFVRFRSLPGLIPLPRLGDLVAERFQRSVGEGVAGRRESWDAGPTPPWISSQQQHATQTDRATDRRERCDGDGPYGSAAEAMPAVEDLRYLKNPLQTRVMATQPYSIWEPYVESATTWPTQAVVDGIRNYGQPIVFSPSLALVLPPAIALMSSPTPSKLNAALDLATTRAAPGAASVPAGPENVPLPVTPAPNSDRDLVLQRGPTTR